MIFFTNKTEPKLLAVVHNGTLGPQARMIKLFDDGSTVTFTPIEFTAEMKKMFENLKGMVF